MNIFENEETFHFKYEIKLQIDQNLLEMFISQSWLLLQIVQRFL
jgi:hypothetical protein